MTIHQRDWSIPFANENQRAALKSISANSNTQRHSHYGNFTMTYARFSWSRHLVVVLDDGAERRAVWLLLKKKTKKKTSRYFT